VRTREHGGRGRKANWENKLYPQKKLKGYNGVEQGTPLGPPGRRERTRGGRG